MNNKTIIFITIGVAVIVAVIGAAWYAAGIGTDNNTEPKNYDTFAKCLTEKGVVMYGTDWCPHCKNEKARFGSSFQYVTYVECSKEPKQCIEAGVKGVPSWIFPDGRKFEGEQGLQKLSEESGCPLP